MEQSSQDTSSPSQHITQWPSKRRALRSLEQAVSHERQTQPPSQNTTSSSPPQEPTPLSQETPPPHPPSQETPPPPSPSQEKPSTTPPSQETSPPPPPSQETLLPPPLSQEALLLLSLSQERPSPAPYSQETPPPPSPSPSSSQQSASSSASSKPVHFIISDYAQSAIRHIVSLLYITRHHLAAERDAYLREYPSTPPPSSISSYYTPLKTNLLRLRIYLTAQIGGPVSPSLLQSIRKSLIGMMVYFARFTEFLMGVADYYRDLEREKKDGGAKQEEEVWDEAKPANLRELQTTLLTGFGNTFEGIWNALGMEGRASGVVQNLQKKAVQDLDKKKEEGLKKREEDLKKKEEDLKKREEELQKKEDDLKKEEGSEKKEWWEEDLEKKEEGSKKKKKNKGKKKKGKSKDKDLEKKQSDGEKEGEQEDEGVNMDSSKDDSKDVDKEEREQEDEGVSMNSSKDNSKDVDKEEWAEQEDEGPWIPAKATARKWKQKRKE